MEQKNLKPILNNDKKPKKPKATVADRLNEFIFMNSWRMDEASTSFIEKLCGELLEYFYTHKEARFVNEFLNEKNINKSVFVEWTKKHSKLGEVYKQVKQLIATRREKGALEGELKERTFMYIQHMYDSEWDEANKYWAALKQEETESKIPTVIQLSHLESQTEIGLLKEENRRLQEKINKRLMQEEEE